MVKKERDDREVEADRLEGQLRNQRRQMAEQQDEVDRLTDVVRSLRA